MHDLIAESPFPQLRTASVGLLKDIVGSRLSVASESPLASPALLRDMLPVLLRLPAGLPEAQAQAQGSDPTEYASSERALGACLDEHTSWWNECSNFLFFLLKRDAQNRTGIKNPSELDEIQTRFLRPLRAFVEGWSSKLSAMREGQGEGSSPLSPISPLAASGLPVAMPMTSSNSEETLAADDGKTASAVLGQLALLHMALDRVDEALEQQEQERRIS